MSDPTRIPTRLADRIEPPSRVGPPAEMAGITWRPAEPTDAATIHALELLIGQVEHPGLVTLVEEFEHDLARDGVDLRHDSLLGFDDDGRLVAWAMAVLLPVVGDVVKVAVPGGVHLDRRGEGLGTVLLDWQDRRGRELLATVDRTDPGWLITYADEAAVDRIALHEAFGYGLRRWWFELTRDLGVEIPAIDLDPAVRLVRYDPEWSERTRLARNDVFRDHWGSQDTPSADWEATRGLPISRPDLSWIAVDPTTEEVVAFVLVSVNEDEWEHAGHSFGYIEYVGVRRAFRGRRIAQALITHTLCGLRDAGLSHATLDVDSESPTGARGLYANLGFTPINRSVSLVKEF